MAIRSLATERRILGARKSHRGRAAFNDEKPNVSPKHDHGVSPLHAWIRTSFASSTRTGPRMRLNDGRALPNFVAPGAFWQSDDGVRHWPATRSFCYVFRSDRGIYRLMLSDEHLPTTLAIAEITILEFAERVRKALSECTGDVCSKPLPQDDPKQRCPDIRKARLLLNWSPK